MKVLAVVLLSLVVFGQAAHWPNFRTKFDFNLFDSETFRHRPLTKDEAVEEGWELIEDGCSTRGKWLGYRYIQDSDPSFVLIFDQNGYIAGSQSGLRVSDTNGDQYYPFSTTPIYQLGTFEDEEMYFTTAYFVDPSIICTGRSDDDFGSQGAGDRVWFQNGETPDIFVKAPATKPDAMADEFWNKHLCFIGMGDHFMTFNYEPDQDCGTIFPVQILYDHFSEENIGFVWQHIANLPGNRWEHPDKTAISVIVDRPPTCLNALSVTPKLSTMHHYFVNVPELEFCPPIRSQEQRFKQLLK